MTIASTPAIYTFVHITHKQKVRNFDESFYTLIFNELGIIIWEIFIEF